MGDINGAGGAPMANTPQTSDYSWMRNEPVRYFGAMTFRNPKLRELATNVDAVLTSKDFDQAKKGEIRKDLDKMMGELENYKFVRRQGPRYSTTYWLLLPHYRKQFEAVALDRLNDINGKYRLGIRV